jgi:5-oxoprolinase (ATP-hydrolysing)
VAARLGIDTVLVHPCAAVLAAWGQALARREEQAVAPIWAPLTEVAPSLPARADALAAALPALGERSLTVDLRFTGTDHALPIPWSADAEAVAAAFRDEHRRRYGFDRPQATIEVVNLRARARAPEAPPPAVPDDPWAVGDATVTGPTTLRAPTTTVHVPPGWTARRADGLLRLERQDRAPAAAGTTRTPHGVALWGARFMAVAEQAGAVLQRLARSVNIKERLDFSCAVFDEAGGLVANAPHIPVHLGAMGETVRDVLRHEQDLPDGACWLTNDPSAGGSHLPDLTVVTAVAHEGRRFFVASRGHHVDVGGLTPGSMPPTSARLADEGLVFRRVRLDGDVDWDVLLAGSRQPDTVRADLEAQRACNHAAAAALRALGPADLLATWMAHLQDVADEAVGRLIDGLVAGAAADALDGIPLRLALRPAGGRLTVDLAGTGGPHPGNLNAPPAVVRAAVLYALRVLVDAPIPLNEGALRRVDLALPPGSLVDPPAGAAIVGGNVETSQRVAELVLRAAGARAAGQGTMNNLTLGGPGWSLYETLGGGQGASPRGPGLSGRQVHMTNTRATDVEVLETRLPLRVRRFSVRRGSGGDGAHRGGEGLIRELELLAPGAAALLATRRGRGAPGLDGGGAGAPGVDQLVRDGVSVAWDGRPVALGPGDRVRVASPGGGGWGLATKN